MAEPDNAQTIASRRRKGNGEDIVGTTRDSELFPQPDNEDTVVRNPSASPESAGETIVRGRNSRGATDDTIVRGTSAWGSTEDTVVAQGAQRDPVSHKGRRRSVDGPAVGGIGAVRFSRVAFVPPDPSTGPRERYRAQVVHSARSARRPETTADAQSVGSGTPALRGQGYLLREAREARKRLLLGAVVIGILVVGAIVGIVVLLST